jgi:hypothetical protein
MDVNGPATSAGAATDTPLTPNRRHPATPFLTFLPRVIAPSAVELVISVESKACPKTNDALPLLVIVPLFTHNPPIRAPSPAVTVTVASSIYPDTLLPDPVIVIVPFPDHPVNDDPVPEIASAPESPILPVLAPMAKAPAPVKLAVAYAASK